MENFTKSHMIDPGSQDWSWVSHLSIWDITGTQKSIYKLKKKKKEQLIQNEKSLCVPNT